jgi:hypothetical protein
MKTIKFLLFFLLPALVFMGCKKSIPDPEDPSGGTGGAKHKMVKYNYSVGTILNNSSSVEFNGKKFMQKDVLYMIGGYGADNSLLMMGYETDTSIVFAKKLNFPQNIPHIDNMISDGSGGFIIAGRYERGYPFVARISTAGELLWSKKITDTKNRIYSTGTDMYVIPGLSEVKNQRFALFFNSDIILFDTDGEVKWRVKTTRAYRGVIMEDGIIAFGQRSGDTRFTIRKLDMDGKLLWSKHAEKAPNSAMAFGSPLVLRDNSILLSYVHKSTIDASANYGLFNITPDGHIKSNKLYLAAPIHPSYTNRPAELHRKSDDKIWFHFPGRKYVGAGVADPLEVGFNLNEDGTVDKSGFFQGINSSFGFANNKVLSIHQGNVTDGSLSASCSSTGNGGLLFRRPSWILVR